MLMTYSTEDPSALPLSNSELSENDMVWHILTAIGLTPAGSSTEHIYTQTVHRTTQ
jgi:hypothetical protein